MVQRWTDIMREGSFDGIKLPIMRIGSRGGRTLAMHTYPDVPGQEVEDQGRRATTFNVDLVYGPDLANIWGANIYPEGPRLLIERFERGGTGIFVHPLWGEVEVAVEDWTRDDDASRPDVTHISVVFVEDSLDPFTLEDSTSLNKTSEATARSEAVDLHLQSVEGETGTPFSDLVSEFKLMLYDIRATRYIIESRWLNFRADIRALVDSYESLSNPSYFNIIEEIILMEGAMTELVSSLDNDFPLIVTEVVNSETSFIALAVKLYGDKSRADELGSINSHVFNPMRVPAGTVISYRSE